MQYSLKIFISLFLIITVITITASQVKAENLPLYSCDTCNSVKATILARQKSPSLKCHWTNPPNTPPIPGDEVCYSSSKTVFFANPLTRQAYKFEVVSQATNFDEKSVTVTPLGITGKEQELINTFYTLDAEYRKAANTFVNLNLNDSLNAANFTTPGNSLASLDNKVINNYGINATSNSDMCKNHPTSYFSARGKSRIQKEMRRKIAEKIGNDSWSDHWEETKLTGVGLTIGRDAIGFNVSFMHNAQGVFAHTMWGSEDNLLNFAVTYGGDYYIGGTRKLNLEFKLLNGSSYVDGLVLDSILDDARVDLSDTLISNCLNEYINDYIDRITTNVVISGPSGGSNPGSGGNSGGISLCTRTVHTVAGNRSQVFIFRTPC